MNNPNGENPLDTLLDPGEVKVPDTAAAYGRYVARYGYQESRRALRKHPRRPIWVGVAAACLLVALFSFAPARSWGQRILSMLRVQKVAVVPVDLEAFSAAAGGHEKQIAQMISDRLVVTMKPGEPEAVNSPDEASTAAGFNVKTLDGLGTPAHIKVRDESAFHIELDRDRMLALVEAAGRSDISVPKSVDGSIIAVHIPKVVDIAYGDCSGQNRQNCLHFTQLPSPVISIPPSLDMANLAEAALQVTGMTAAEAHSFCQTVDWSSTLVIPVARNASSSRTVPVDGVTGTLVESTASGRHAGEFVLIWVKNRRLFSIAGAGDPNHALAVAESLN